MRTGFISLLLLASMAGAQTINPNQIRPGTNGQVLTTSSGVTGWAAGTFTLGGTTMQLGGTFTTVTGLTVNGVTLVTGGNANLFLNQAGTYTAPTVSAPTFATIASGTNTSAAMVCGTGCTLGTSGTGTITPNAINLAASGNGGVTGNLPPGNLNGGVGASSATAWFGDGTWKTISPGGVTSINTVPGAFTFSGAGVNCTGTTCTFTGAGAANISGLTAGHIPLAGSASTLTANSHIDEVTNPGKTTITQPAVINDGTGNAGSFGLTAGTTPPAPLANTVVLQAPAAVTAYAVTLPNAQGTGSLTNDGSGNLSWNAAGLAGSLANNVLLNSPSTGNLFVEADSIGLIANGGFPEKLATLLGIPGGNQSIKAIGSASLADLLTCATAGAGNCTQDGTLPLSFPLGVASNSKTLLEFAYNDLSNMGGTPTNPQLSYYYGGLKAWMLEFGIPDSQKLTANGAYCTTTGSWTSVSAVPGGVGTFPAGTIKSTTPGSTLVCTTRNATDAGIIGYKSTGSTTATFTVDVVNAGTTYHVADPYTASTTLNQTAAYTSAWGATANLYAIGQSGMGGGYTTTTVTASNNSSDPVIIVAPYFISPSSSLQNFPAVEMMLESRAGCNGTCSSVGGAQHNDTKTNIMRTAQINAVNELRNNGLNISYFDPNATPSGFNSSDNTQTSDGTHPNSTSAQFIANTAFVNLNSAATTQDHFLPAAGCTNNCTISDSTGTTPALTLQSAYNLALDVHSSNSNGPFICLQGTASGVDDWCMASASNSASLTGHTFLIGDITSGNFSWGQTVDVTGLGKISSPSLMVDCWTPTNSITAVPCDTGLSRDAAGVVDVGNGTQGNKSGTVKAASLLASGTVDGTAPVTITTGTTATLGGTFKSGYTFNQEATAATAVAYTLPTAAAGLQYCIGNSWNGSAATTGVLTLNTSASGQFIIFTDGTLTATGGNITSGGAAADAACVVGVDATHWQLYVQRGTWSKH